MSKPPPLTEDEDRVEVSRISVENLVAALKDGGGRTSVLDVRSAREFAGGHIVGARHVECEELLDSAGGNGQAKELLSEVLKSGAEMLVVHCMYSQSRGPAVVELLAGAAAEVGAAHVQIALLDGGFHKFMNAVWPPSAPGEGDAKASDIPGILECVKPEAYRYTTSHGFVEAEAVAGLEELGVSIGGGEAPGSAS